MDNEIDDAEVALSKELISLMKADSTNIDSCKVLVLIVKDIERIADLENELETLKQLIKFNNENQNSNEIKKNQIKILIDAGKKDIFR